jgi:hypothetical protein
MSEKNPHVIAWSLGSRSVLNRDKLRRGGRGEVVKELDEITDEVIL